MDKQFLRECAEAIKAKLPDGYCFILMAAPSSDYAPGDNRLVYVSSMQRECAINVLKEFLIKASGPEEWLKHIK